jgi:hypothetical protein
MFVLRTKKLQKFNTGNPEALHYIQSLRLDSYPPFFVRYLVLKLLKTSLIFRAVLRPSRALGKIKIWGPNKQI